MTDGDLETRARRHAALGDPVRLSIVESLSSSDRSPVELRRMLGIESNLLAHHLDVLGQAGLIDRTRSSGDGRRRYVRLLSDALPTIEVQPRLRPAQALFVCTRNSARSQLAAAVWRAVTGVGAESAGTHPADRVHPGAVAAAKRAKLPIRPRTPRSIDDVNDMPSIVITVCDQAHEELDPPDWWMHWSITDPVPNGSAKAFDATVAELRRRVALLLGAHGVDR